MEPFYEYWADYDEWFDRHRELYLSELAALKLVSRGSRGPGSRSGSGAGGSPSP